MRTAHSPRFATNTLLSTPTSPPVGSDANVAARAKRGALQHWGLTPLLRRAAAQPGPKGRHRCPAATESELHPRAKRRCNAGGRSARSPNRQRWRRSSALHPSRRLEFEQRLAVLHRLGVRHEDPADHAGVLGLELVEELHRLEDAQRLADLDPVALV